MAKNRKNTLPILIDIKFDGSMNKFEETYGDQISYAEIEQESYIDLKVMMFEKVSTNIKFRKFNRENNTLTLKADMLEKEYQFLQDILSKKITNEKATNDKKNNPNGDIILEKFNFLHPFIISKIKIMTNEDLLKLKKNIILNEEHEEEGKIIEVPLEEAENFSEEEFE